MSRSEFTVRRERKKDAAAVARLSAQAFGPGRFARSAYRVREAHRGSSPGKLDLCAWCGNVLAGSLHFSPVQIGGKTGALLLGPLAINPEFAGLGCGGVLIAEGLQLAKAAGHRLVILVGDHSFYGKFGFEVSRHGRLTLPAPADPARILVLELAPNVLGEYKGPIRMAAP